MDPRFITIQLPHLYVTKSCHGSVFGSTFVRSSKSPLSEQFDSSVTVQFNSPASTSTSNTIIPTQSNKFALLCFYLTQYGQQAFLFSIFCLLFSVLYYWCHWNMSLRSSIWPRNSSFSVYTLYCHDRSLCGSGVLLAVDKSIPVLSSFNLPDIEVVPIIYSLKVSTDCLCCLYST